MILRQIVKKINILYSIDQKKANAFVEPNNPNAVFPQIAKPDIMDFRSHKIINGGLAAINTFRKLHNDKCKKSKYVNIVKTAEELEEEAK